MVETNERDYLTLVDEQGNEELFEILLTIDGQEEFGKNYVLLCPSNVPDGEEVELLAYSYEEDENGEGGKLNEITTDKEWDMVEEVFGAFMAEESECDHEHCNHKH
ncbi:DUF1292 domain-containing protein [Catellicoccus marimammalium]|uniref:UPF0473 protein C683_0133 n=1 Tax=Catellicoccus marimammalium M35/04/3 TaxID=1234409 RepID=K8Z9Z5_9ENTE|nr:DUF1292 domain-containing protein [Catellicoccus marimammalium]EKU27874.1 hypothetical protein C683_0133 [Catellicoccus marimammalium M35/04/3]